jgi:hypothetical protein
MENTAKALAAVRHIRKNQKLMVTRDDLIAATELFIRRDTIEFKNKTANEHDLVMNYLATLNNSIIQFEEDFHSVISKLKKGVGLDINEIAAIDSYAKTVNPSVSQAVLEYYIGHNNNTNE